VSTIGEDGIEEPVIVFFRLKIIEWYPVSLDRWRIEEKIVIEYFIWSHHKAVSQIISSNKSFHSSWWYTSWEGIIAVWFFIWSVWEELDGELSIFIGLDHFTTIDKVSSICCLIETKSRKKWPLIEDKSFIIQFCKSKNREEEDEDEDEFFHIFS
jgi:hypothetical protein